MNFKAKKFALIGAASLGKTTIFEKLKEAIGKNPKLFHTTYFVEEAARDLINLYKPTWPFTYHFQLKIQTEQLAREKQAHKIQSSLIICDRSVLDAVIYAKTAGFLGWKYLFERVKDWIPTYTKFFLLDIVGVPFKRDYTRKDAIQFRETIHNGFVNFLESNNLPYEKIVGTEAQRLEKILTEIQMSSNKLN